MLPFIVADAFLSLYLTMKRKMFHYDSMKVTKCKFCIFSTSMSLSFFSNYSMKHYFMRYSVSIIPLGIPPWDVIRRRNRPSSGVIFICPSLHCLLSRHSPPGWVFSPLSCWNLSCSLLPPGFAHSVPSAWNSLLPPTAEGASHGYSVILQAPPQITCLQRSFSH